MRERYDLDLSQFPRRCQLFAAEGGAVYLDERDGLYYVISDESTLADMLNEEDAGLAGVVIYEFESDAARDEYLRQRRWLLRLNRYPRSLEGRTQVHAIIAVDNLRSQE
jgi:hypothetical protein